MNTAIAPSNVLGPDALPAPGFSDSNSPSLTKGHPYPSAVGDENPSTLSLIAASAIDSDTVVPDSRVDEDQQSPTQPSQAFMSPPGLRSVQPVSSWESQDIAPRDSSQDQAAAKAGKALAFHRVIAMSPPRSHRNSTEHEVSLNSPRTKVRGKFSDTRRKEVQEVRKKGACIRCRMLRKTVGLFPASCLRLGADARYSVLEEILAIAVRVSKVPGSGSILVCVRVWHMNSSFTELVSDPNHDLQNLSIYLLYFSIVLNSSLASNEPSQKPDSHARIFRSG